MGHGCFEKVWFSYWVQWGSIECTCIHMHTISRLGVTHFDPPTAAGKE